MSATSRIGVAALRLLPDEQPVRRMALATLVNTTGNGILFTLQALYFTRIVGFSVVQVGAGLSIAAGVAIVAGIPIGHLADRRGARGVLITLSVLTGCAAAVFLLVDTWWQYVVVATVVAVLDRGAGAVRSALIAGLVQGAARAGTKAYLRSITNVGMTLGAAIAALALHFDTRGAYLTVLYLDVATYFVTAFVLLGVPRIAGRAADAGPGMLAGLRDLPFLTVAMVSSVLAMHYWILELAIPLWVVNETDAPRALVSVLLISNTVVVVAFQVAVAKRVTTVASAVRATLVSGVVFFAACLVIGLSADLAAGLASLVLVAGALLQVVGELFQAAASFLLGFELPPEDAMGAYQGVWGMSFSVSSFAAPTVIALLPLALGLVGWVLLGSILLVSALATGPAVAWAVRSKAARERQGVGLVSQRLAE